MILNETQRTMLAEDLAEKIVERIENVTERQLNETQWNVLIEDAMSYTEDAVSAALDAYETQIQGGSA